MPDHWWIVKSTKSQAVWLSPCSRKDIRPCSGHYNVYRCTRQLSSASLVLASYPGSRWAGKRRAWYTLRMRLISSSYGDSGVFSDSDEIKFSRVIKRGRGHLDMHAAYQFVVVELLQECLYGIFRCLAILPSFLIHVALCLRQFHRRPWNQLTQKWSEWSKSKSSDWRKRGHYEKYRVAFHNLVTQQFLLFSSSAELWPVKTYCTELYQF